MSDNGSAEGSAWPMPKFRFEVDLGAELQGVAFQEISGMDMEAQVIEYRASNSPLFSIPILKALCGQTAEGLDRVVAIHLLDADGGAVLTWTLKGARVRSISFSDLRSGANELAGYSVELAHDGIQLEVAG